MGLASIFMPGPVAATGPFRTFDRQLPALMKSYRVPGMSIAVVRPDGGIEARGYGLADVAAGRRMTPDTVFEAASVSKTAAAWLAMRFVQQGRLSLDRPVEPRLGGWRFPPSPYPSDGVTLRRLLSHTAGLNVPGYLGFPEGRRPQTLLESLSGANDAGGQRVRVATPPGRAFRYSGGGYSVLELLLERNGGEPFPSLMKREVLAPLGMRLSGFVADEALLRRMSRSYDARGRPQPRTTYAALAAAGLLTTAPDLARMLAVLIAGMRGADNPVLTAATVRRMLTPQPGATTRDGWGDVRWGLGYGLVDLSAAGPRMAFHPGDNIPGWHALVAAVDRPGIGLVVLTNGENGRSLRDVVLCLWLKVYELPAARVCGR